MAYPANFYEAFNSEVDALNIGADFPAVHVVGIMTRAAKRAQMVVDRELAPIGQRGNKAGSPSLDLIAAIKEADVPGSIAAGIDRAPRTECRICGKTGPECWH